MALKPADDKPMLPLARPAGHIQCAADASCKCAGRLWVEGMDAGNRLCVDHYYRWVDEHRGKAPIDPRIP